MKLKLEQKIERKLLIKKKRKNMAGLYQNYQRICLQNKLILKTSWSICNIFSKYSRRFERNMEHIRLLTTRGTDDLEKSIEEDLKLENVTAIVDKLKTADDSSLLNLPKRTWGSVFYQLNQNKEFERLDEIRAKTKKLNINCGEGALTTLIKSYTGRNQSWDAVNVLEEMKNTELLRHTRTYFPVITSLAENGRQNEAFELFHQMQHHTFKSNKGVTLSIPSTMTVSLIMSCVQSEISDYSKAKDVLLWYNQSGRPLTPEILNAIKMWLDSDPENNWIITKCQVSEEGLCNNCKEYLNSGILTVNEKEELKSDIVNTIEDMFNSRSGAGKREKFDKYKTFLKQYSPCDVIIDGMSIGLSSSVEKQKKRFNFNTLLNVSNYFVDQGSKVLVLLNRSIPPSFLSNNVQYFISDVGDDDLYIMYASAVWNMASFLVTRDKFREHRFLFSFRNHASYMKWIRSQTIKVGVKRDQLTFRTQKYDPVVQNGNSSWHFPLVDGNWFCARKL